MVRGTLSRRGFLSRSMAALTIGAGLPYWFAREVLAAEEEADANSRKKVGPNDRIALGAIGTGGQGYRVMTEAVQKRADFLSSLVAACDVDADATKCGDRQIEAPGTDSIDEAMATSENCSNARTSTPSPSSLPITGTP